MSPKKIIWASAAVAVLALLAFTGFGCTAAGVRNVDAAGAEAAIKAGAQVIDVRSAGEFEMGHIPGAVNVPVDGLEAAAASWDKNARYLVYCASGSRSAVAVQTMQALGFRNIDHLAQGIQVWTQPLETGQASASQTVPTSGKPVLIEFFTNS